MVNTSLTKQHRFKYNILTNYESIYFSTSPQVRTQNWCDRPFYFLSEVIWRVDMSYYSGYVLWKLFKQANWIAFNFTTFIFVLPLFETSFNYHFLTPALQL